MPRGYFGIGVCHGKSVANIGTLFRSAQCFGADFVFTVGRRYVEQASDTMKTWRHVPLFNFASLEDLRAHLPFGCRLIGVEIDDRARTLPAYSHPERACYLLGAEDHGLRKDEIAVCHELIAVPGASRCLNVASAGTVVLYDRAVKVAPAAERPEGTTP